MANEKYKECQLGEWIVPHIIEDLYMIGYLAKKVLEYKNIKSSVRTIYISENWDIKKVEINYLNLDTSHSITLSWLANKVQEFVLLKNDHIGIFEDPSTSHSRPWIKKKNIPLISFKDEVLYDIYGKNAESLEYIEQRIRHAKGASYLFGIMSSLPKSYLPLSTTIDENTIDLLARRCESMIVSAFDGTGYIICYFNH
jgi:hypothetical protein